MMKLKLLGLGVSLFTLSSLSWAMSELTELEMSQAEGQALMSLSYIAPTDTKNSMRNLTGNNIGFYKLGMEAEIQLNANIKNLQLGCGGINNSIAANACDIDIKNLSLTGLPGNYNTTTKQMVGNGGNPDYSTNGGRANTSATLTNPFIEFAIRNPNTASTREVVGLRTSAESISGLLSAGLENQVGASTTDGIQRLSGFLQVAATTGEAFTQQTKFGTGSVGQNLSGYAYVSALGILQSYVRFASQYNHPDSTGITVPRVDTTFDVPAFTVNGTRQTYAEVKNIMTQLAEVPIAEAPGYAASLFAGDQLYVTMGCNSLTGSGIFSGCGIITGLKSDAKFAMAPGSKIQNINMKIDFQQSLSMFHNIPLSGVGGYLSLQSIPLIWPGATMASADVSKNTLSTMTQATDVAQKGWWMSFTDPVNVGVLNVTDPIILDDGILSQVAQRTSQTLDILDINNGTPAIYANNLDDLVSLLGTQPIAAQIVANLNAATAANPVYVQLSNLTLGNQNVTPNCWGNLKFC